MLQAYGELILEAVGNKTEYVILASSGWRVRQTIVLVADINWLYIFMPFFCFSISLKYLHGVFSDITPVDLWDVHLVLISRWINF